MKNEREHLRGRVVVYVAILLLIVGIVAPYIYLPGKMDVSGPGNVYSSPNGTSYLSYYTTYPVPKGQEIQFSVSSDKPDATVVSVCVLSKGTVCDQDFGIFTFQTSGNSTSFVTEMSAPATAQYLIGISSLNKSQFHLVLISVWAPYYDLRLLVYFALPIGIIGVILWYYDRWRFKQFKMHEAAIKGIVKR